MIHRVHIIVRGAVQGVGFRPFIYRLAMESRLCGWVMNSTQGVLIEVEGSKDVLEKFVLRIANEKPQHSSIHSLEYSYLDPVGYTNFEIRKSNESGEISAIVLPDIASCHDCIKELFNPQNRRYLYPFTNCTNCGPRFSIIENLPYDRQNTSMKSFKMCDECLSEYEDPLNRRFHAQPNACPKCGPHIEFWNERGNKISDNHAAILMAVKQIEAGKIVAIKGIGGFHLMVDARNDDAVRRLRERKNREEKPFALMYPSLEMIKQDCEVSVLEERLLLSPESPIVLLKRTSQATFPTMKIEHQISNIAISVAPNNSYLGIMLPYTPLHHILMNELGSPVVATSGNYSDEPICINEKDAVDKLSCIADYFLVHNRPIVRHVDDSIVRVMAGRGMVVRRARGYAPLPIRHNNSSNRSILAVGAHLKNSVALYSGENVFISQHIGDLETTDAYSAFERVIHDFQLLYRATPSSIVSDLHPDYMSTQYAKKSKITLNQIQHHYAHIMSCVAENKIEGEVLGVSWDGSGYGTDGTIWGGEFLLTNEKSYERIATFRNFKLPGGWKAIKEPRRTAVGILYELFGDDFICHDYLQTIKSFSKSELHNLSTMMKKGINSPVTSSAGRLFDAVASIIGISQQVSFEGKAAMELEWAIKDLQTEETYKYRILNIEYPINKSEILDPDESNHRSDSKIIIDWGPLIINILEDVKRKIDVAAISAKFHNTLIEMIVDIGKRIGEKRIALSGGCFQNKYLTERAVHRLTSEGFKPYWHQRVPPNDGGISLGQIAAVMKINTSSL
ncbi:MAG: carbamoyltransferase HypF [Ignavibacteriales bacterium]|nr:carbamoyltransferase HypF [Ignavibacteriales bacterium]